MISFVKVAIAKSQLLKLPKNPVNPQILDILIQTNKNYDTAQITCQKKSCKSLNPGHPDSDK
ncbi:MAG: hypothetical protein ACKO2Z_31615 [Sphaerospermopsis kisseleviana]